MSVCTCRSRHLTHEKEPLVQGKAIKWEIERIVKWRTYRKNGKRHHEALLKWSGFDDECNTWEPANNLPKGVKPGDTKVPGGEGGSAGGRHCLHGIAGDKHHQLQHELEKREKMRRESSVLWPQGEVTCDEEAVEEEQRQRAGLRALLAEVSCTRNHAHLLPTSPQKVSAVLREVI